MNGQFSLANMGAPNYMAMNAVKVIAAPHEFVWKMSGGSGMMLLSGSDSWHWTRFWMASLAPVARSGNDPEHTRSTFRRYTARGGNPDGIHQLQPFGGYLSDFEEAQEFHVPMHIEAGNFFGTEVYFPFFIADVSEVRFPDVDR